MIISEEGLKIINTIEAAGFEAFFVGGCVRDVLMGRSPGDIDIATNAKPADIMNIFEKTVPTGIAHGTVTVIEDGVCAEVTTYRSESVYKDARHPESVSFISNIEEDLKRRDFTVNAIAYNPSRGCVDIFGGTEDIKRKILRCVGDPDERFCEDALRMVRAVRFAAVLGFKISPETLVSIKRNAHLVSNISKERICVELEKCILGDFPKNTELLFETGLANYFTKCDAIDPSALKKLAFLPKHTPLRFAAILKNDMASQFLKELKFSNEIINSTTALINGIGIDDPIEIKQYINKHGFKQAHLLKHLNSNLYKTELEKIVNEKHPVLLRELALGGNDLAEIGITGKRTGEVLSFLLKKIWQNPGLNTKQELLKSIEEEFLK